MDKKLEEDALMEEKKEGRGEHEIVGIKKGEKWNFEVYLIRVSFIKVTTSVTHASIYRLGSFLEKLSKENFLEKLELSCAHPSKN